MSVSDMLPSKRTVKKALNVEKGTFRMSRKRRFQAILIKSLLIIFHLLPSKSFFVFFIELLGQLSQISIYNTDGIFHVDLRDQIILHRAVTTHIQHLLYIFQLSGAFFPDLRGGRCRRGTIDTYSRRTSSA